MDDSQSNEADEGPFENLERISSHPPSLPGVKAPLVKLASPPRADLGKLSSARMEIDSDSWPSRLA